MCMFYHFIVLASFSFAVMWLICTAPMFRSSNRCIMNMYDDDDDSVFELSHIYVC